MRYFANPIKLKSQNSMNGKFDSGLRFKVNFVPGQHTDISEEELKVLKKDPIFNSLVEDETLVASAEEKKTPVQKAEVDLEKAKESLKMATEKKEQKKASENVKKAEATLKKAKKSDKVTKDN